MCQDSTPWRPVLQLHLSILYIPAYITPGLAPQAVMTRFRPCIDLHKGQVKQIVGGTLTTAEADLKTNFTSTHPASYYASLYRDADLFGAHVIMLGPGSDEAALEALSTWPTHLQVGGGITDANAKRWIDAGAAKVSNPSTGPSWTYIEHDSDGGCSRSS
jgi:Histidine biosynthesis protein